MKRMLKALLIFIPGLALLTACSSTPPPETAEESNKKPEVQVPAENEITEENTDGGANTGSGGMGCHYDGVS